MQASFCIVYNRTVVVSDFHLSGFHDYCDTNVAMSIEGLKTIIIITAIIISVRALLLVCFFLIGKCIKLKIQVHGTPDWLSGSAGDQMLLGCGSVDLNPLLHVFPSPSSLFTIQTRQNGQKIQVHGAGY